MPKLNARPENFLIDDFDYSATQDGDIITAQDDTPIVSQNVANNSEDAP